MSQIFKISGYIVDPNDRITDPTELIDFMIRQGLFTQHIHIERSPVKWDNHLPINQVNCDLQECENYFNKKQNVCNDREIVIGGLYRHFKNKIVKVIAVAQDTENVGFYNVVYEELVTGAIWSRPLDMFLGYVDKEKYPNVTQKYRFELVDRYIFKKLT